MKKLNLIVVALTLALLANAQPTDYFMTFGTANAKLKLSPAIKLLEGSVKVFVQYPEKLAYHTDARSMSTLESISAALKLDAKNVRKAADADYIFRITCPGLSTSASQPVYFEENRKATFAVPAANVKGFVYRLKYNMPVTVEIVNKQGTVEKTFLFNTQPGEWIYHRNFLAELQTEDWKPKKATMPFATEKEARDAFAKNEQAIYARMESNTWHYTMQFCKRILEIAYSNYKLSLSKYVYYSLVRKKDKEQLPVLTEAIKKQGDLIEGLEDVKTAQASLDGLQQNLVYFDNLSNNMNEYGPEMQKLILSHAAWDALLTRQLEKAVKYFSRYYAMEKDSYYMDELVPAYKEYFSDYQNHQLLSSKENTLIPTEDISALSAEKKP